ncbi:hypothetical protein CPter91_2002 [Collimonas pratensis]|uniref:Uncharacterized protein n=1 Tax=Collimonas pratensis TaxID=279113 RepID=A0A127Q2V9_9BURK|nr:hypothetical protein CPter91_2002 [Collimonas pratensis]
MQGSWRGLDVYRFAGEKLAIVFSYAPILNRYFLSAAMLP